MLKKKKLKVKKETKGIVLAGGTATRLFPLTATTSKQLLPIFNCQMIFYPLNTLIQGGIKDILIIVAPEHSGHFLNLLGSIFEKRKIKISFQVQSAPRGLAEAFILGEEHIDEDNVALILGDNIFEDNFSRFIKNFKNGGQIFVKKVTDPERFGVVQFNQNQKAIKIIEKPKKWISNFAVTGFYLYDNEVIKIAKKLKPSERGELEITDINSAYLKKGKLKASVFKGAWLDAGTPETLLEAGILAKEKKLSLKFDPLVKDSVLEFNERLKIENKKKLL
jgi:glucose-1-phosphate thymidylyltransferase